MSCQDERAARSPDRCAHPGLSGSGLCRSAKDQLMPPRQACLVAAGNVECMMSDQIPGLPLVKVLEVKVMEPEKQLLMLVEAASGQNLWLMLPTSAAPFLARAAGLEFAAEREEQLRNHALTAFNASWVEFLSIPEEPGALAMSVTFGAGAMMTFRLPSPMPQTMLETLQVAVLPTPAPFSSDDDDDDEPYGTGGAAPPYKQ